MKLNMIALTVASIPSRTSAKQFNAKDGYDIEWLPVQGLFYIHDTQKNHLHAVALGMVTNFWLAAEEPAAFMRELRASPLADLFAAAVTSHGDVRVKVKKSKTSVAADSEAA